MSAEGFHSVRSQASPRKGKSARMPALYPDSRQQIPPQSVLPLPCYETAASAPVGLSAGATL